MGEHSLLSASAAHRWLNCTASVNFTKDMPDTESQYAAEGTLAHAWCEYKLKKALGDPTARKPEQKPDAIMSECVDAYVAEVMAVVAGQNGKPYVFVEQRIDYSSFAVANSFGTADCVILSEDKICIFDFKYGMGVPVSAENNPQLMLYAAGAYQMFGQALEIREDSSVELHIYQPRISNSNNWSLPLSKLIEICNENFKPKAMQAVDGKQAHFEAGDWCRFCKGKAICRARADANLARCRKDFALPPELSDDEIAELLPKLDEINKWCEDLKDYALKAALDGHTFDGFKVVEGRTTRKYKNEEIVAQIVKNQGLDPYDHKVLGITAMQKLLGRKRFDDLLGGELIKSQGKPVLVPESDKRQALTETTDFVIEE